MMKIIKLKITINNWEKMAMYPTCWDKYHKIITKTKDLSKTKYLKTAMIENEWSIKLIKDIFEGP